MFAKQDIKRFNVLPTMAVMRYNMITKRIFVERIKICDTIITTSSSNFKRKRHSSSKIINDETGINIQAFSVYPNPSSNEISITLKNSTTKDAAMQLTDIT